MEKVDYTGPMKDFVDKYDGVSYDIWNSTSGTIVDLRKHVRDHYLQEQRFMCAYCRIEKKESHGLTWDIEHILPKSKFPRFLFEPENLAISCKECNSPKDDQDLLLITLKDGAPYPSTSKSYAIIHPHFDVYSDHFEVTVMGGRRKYRILNKEKARTTYIACNFFRFDYQYGEWDSFDKALVGAVSKFLDRCPSDAAPQEIKRMLGQLAFVENCDF